MNYLTKNLSVFVLSWALVSANIFASSEVLEKLKPEVRTEEFSLSKKGLALDGYDPVAYFDAGPVKGSKSISHTFKGVQYYFSSEGNRQKFIEDPYAYEPYYGGWCAWAMADGGGRTKANPESFKIIDGKLYVFYDGIWGDTLKLWNDVGDDQKLIDAADGHWVKQVSK